jgi:hypothetical protein
LRGKKPRTKEETNKLQSFLSEQAKVSGREERERDYLLFAFICYIWAPRFFFFSFSASSDSDSD